MTNWGGIGETVSDMITSKLEEDFIKIKENKKFYDILHKAFFINITSENKSFDNIIILNALENLSKKYNISLLFGTYELEKTKAKIAGHFNIKKEDIITLNIKKSIILDEGTTELTIVNNISYEARYKLKTKDQTKIGKINFLNDTRNIDKVSVMIYVRGEPLDVVNI